MKKFLLIMSAVFISATMMIAYAQSCRIDGGSIEVTGCSYDNGVVTVVVANDSPTSANVKLTVRVHYGAKTKDYPSPYATYVSGNNPGKEIKINVDKRFNNADASYAEVVSITGTKCQQ